MVIDEKIVNLTPHAIVLMDEEGSVIATFPPSGQVARVNTSVEVVGFTSFLPWWLRPLSVGTWYPPTLDPPLSVKTDRSRVFVDFKASKA